MRKDLSMLLVEELALSLEAHEQRRRKKDEEFLDQALQAKTIIKEKKVSYTQNIRGQWDPDGRSRG